MSLTPEQIKAIASRAAGNVLRNSPTLPEGVKEINSGDIQDGECIDNVACADHRLLCASHVTDDPQIVIKALKEGRRRDTTRGEGLVGDLGTAGLYFSVVPQLWTGRAHSKWTFLNEIDKEHLQSLIENLTSKVETQRKENYITQGEKEIALRDIGYVKSGELPPDQLVYLSGQPYNIEFWKPEYLKPLGIEQKHEPKIVDVCMEGKFADVTNFKSGNMGDLANLMEDLKSAKFDGALVKQGLFQTAQGVVWNNKAVKEFASYKAETGVFSNKTDVPYYDRLLKEGKAKIVEMSPDEYIERTAEMQGTGIQRQMDMAPQANVNKYADMMRSGIKFDMPYLDYKDKDQEGRARSLAAKQVGEKKIPVLIVEAEKIGKELGESIAKQVGAHYDGIQVGNGTDIPDTMEFTDNETGSTTYGNTLKEVRDKISEMRTAFAKADKKKAEADFTKQDNVNACPNLQPMAEWIKGETPGTCRPCTLTPVVQWYWEELKERGYAELAKELEDEVEVLEEDNVEQIMAICKDLDEIKANAPEDLRKRLEEFDCAIQSFDPAEFSGEA